MQLHSFRHKQDYLLFQHVLNYSIQIYRYARYNMDQDFLQLHQSQLHETHEFYSQLFLNNLNHKLQFHHQQHYEYQNFQ